MSRYSFEVDNEVIYDWRQMYNDLLEMIGCAEDATGDSDLTDTLVSALDEIRKCFK